MQRQAKTNCNPIHLGNIQVIVKITIAIFKTHVFGRWAESIYQFSKNSEFPHDSIKNPSFVFYYGTIFGLRMVKGWWIF